MRPCRVSGSSANAAHQSISPTPLEQNLEIKATMRTTTGVCCVAIALLASCVAHAAVPCVIPVTTASPLGGCVFLIDGVASNAACSKFETLIAASTGYRHALQAPAALFLRTCTREHKLRAGSTCNAPSC